MAELDVVPFFEEHLDDAARLLAARQARHREAEPALPERFEDPAATRAEIEKAWRAEDASGTAALREGRVAGYLIGTPREAKTWGENVWVELAGHAVEEPEDLRDLYAEAAARWVEEGRTRHYALVPADDEGLVGAWFRVGFGQQHAHALQEVAPREVAPPPGIEIREPRADEIEELIEVDLALPAHQSRSPVFSDIDQPTREELREEWASTLADDEEHVLVAYEDGKPVRSGRSRRSRSRASTGAWAGRSAQRFSASPRPSRSTAARASGSPSPTPRSPGPPRTGTR